MNPEVIELPIPDQVANKLENRQRVFRAFYRCLCTPRANEWSGATIGWSPLLLPVSLCCLCYHGAHPYKLVEMPPNVS